MATLDIPRTYEDGEVLTEAQIDSIKSELETYFNVTKVDDDVIQNSGISGNTKLADASVSAAKFGAGAVTTAKIIDLAVTTSKLVNSGVDNAALADNAITSAKLATTFGRGQEGCTTWFHTFNGTLSVPRGWMVCDGSIINETNYESLHGAGTYTTDGIASSSILSKYLPNFSDKYPIGVSSTTQVGGSAITSVGNISSEINLEHSHTIPSHTHTVTDPAGGTSYIGVTLTNTVTSSFTSGSSSATTGNSLSSTQNIQPESIKYLFIMKVI